MAMCKAHRVAMGLVLGMMIGPGAIASDEPSIGRGVGQRVANFTLSDVTSGAARLALRLRRQEGRRAGLHSAPTARSATSTCPAWSSSPRAYKDKGVVFLGINSNAHETAEQVAEHAREHGVDFPVLKDPGNVVADLLLAERTCEVLVLDGRPRLRYRGGDRRPVRRRDAARTAPASTTWPRPSTPSWPAGAVAVTATPVVGCLIDRVEPSRPAVGNARRVRPAAPEIVAALGSEAEAPVEVGAVTYAADVAPILQDKCQSCHRPGQVGPVLAADLRRRPALGRDRSARSSTTAGCPPGTPTRATATSQNDRSLTASERATLLAWVDQGTPLGDPQDIPAAADVPRGLDDRQARRRLRDPRAVHRRRPGGASTTSAFRVPTGFTEDRWVQAAEARPGDRSVVHHIIVYVDDHDRNEDRRGSSDAHLCGYAPGDMPSIYPAGHRQADPGRVRPDLRGPLHADRHGPGPTARRSA